MQMRETNAAPESAGNISWFYAGEEDEGERLDRVVAVHADSLSRSRIQALIKDGRITVGAESKKPVKPAQPVHDGDVIRIDLPEKLLPDIVPEDIPLDILYEDGDVLVVNKPKGMVVHPANGHYTGTLVNAVMFHCQDLSGINGVLRPGIVHRIDKDTTGSVIICKNDSAHQSIAEQLKEHTIVRRYVALCFGVPDFEKLAARFPQASIGQDGALIIDAPIGRDPKERKRMAIVPDGKHAVTHVRILERFDGYCLLECQLETGRTHQIRVHLTSVGHPLVGDRQYGGNRKTPWKLEGQCLHAKTLGFVHPETGQYIETEAPLPDYFENLLRILRSRQ